VDYDKAIMLQRMQQLLEMGQQVQLNSSLTHFLALLCVV
jgi:hypothetical protein